MMAEERQSYYGEGIQPIDLIDAQSLDFNLGNVVKYVCRAGVKTTDPMPDLKKAMWYLQHEMDHSHYCRTCINMGHDSSIVSVCTLGIDKLKNTEATCKDWEAK